MLVIRFSSFQAQAEVISEVIFEVIFEARAAQEQLELLAIASL